MKSTFGQQIVISLFGESHGAMCGVVIDGLAAGIRLNLEELDFVMDKRRAKSAISTGRQESDQVRIVSGFFEEHTTGTPLTLLIENTAQHSKDYAKTKALLRPSHADFTAYEKYGGFQDYRGGGHFSGRITAPLTAAGAIALQILRSQGIEIATHIKQLHTIHDKEFCFDDTLLSQQKQLQCAAFPTLDTDVAQEMTQAILQTKEQHDSLGGILESVVSGMPTGIGEPFFHSIESVLSSYLFSVPAVKGVSFGLGFDFAQHMGSEVNDIFIFDKTIKTATNHNGGINGGISNGMPITIQTCIKPTASILRPQQTVNYETKEETTLTIEGRHDPAIIHRAAVVVDCVIALGLLDLCVIRHGTQWMRKSI